MITDNELLYLTIGPTSNTSVTSLLLRALNANLAISFSYQHDNSVDINLKGFSLQYIHWLDPSIRVMFHVYDVSTYMLNSCDGVIFIKCCSFFFFYPWWLWPNITSQKEKKKKRPSTKPDKSGMYTSEIWEAADEWRAVLLSTGLLSNISYHSMFYVVAVAFLVVGNVMIYLFCSFLFNRGASHMHYTGRPIGLTFSG